MPLFTSPPTCRSWSPTGSILNLIIFTKGKLPLRYISPSTWGNQRGASIISCIKEISGAVAGDSTLQDRGVAHYLYLCFLVFLVYLSVFASVSFIKKKI